MMRQFSFQATRIHGLIRVTPFVAQDNRGAFIKDYAKEVFEQNELRHELREVFYTQSHTGVLRGMHFQRVKPQAKLVRCLVGQVYDVVVDLKKDSPTFGQWQGFELSAESQDALLIPGTCAHGYLVLSPSMVSYQCDERFYGEYDDGIAWDDTTVGIKWPVHLVGNQVIVSDKDRALQSFAEFCAAYGGL